MKPKYIRLDNPTNNADIYDQMKSHFLKLDKHYHIQTVMGCNDGENLP